MTIYLPGGREEFGKDESTEKKSAGMTAKILHMYVFILNCGNKSCQDTLILVLFAYEKFITAEYGLFLKQFANEIIHQ